MILSGVNYPKHQLNFRLQASKHPLSKKRAEGKHYNVAISHAAKKLVRVIYRLEKSQQLYNK